LPSNDWWKTCVPMTPSLFHQTPVRYVTNGWPIELR
jgi:hypothetical protein